MRFSTATLWLDVKVRLVVAGLVFAIGFHGGLLHKVLTQAFWPGTETLAGILVFLGLGVLLGLRLPRIGKKMISRLKPGLLTREINPVKLAGTVLTLLTVLVLVTVILGALLTRSFASGAWVLPKRFVLTPFAWRLLTFLVPLLPAGILGTVFGLVLMLAFTAFIFRKCPNHLRSEQPEVQATVSLLLVWVLLALGIAWPLGFYLSEAFLDRWLILILVPVIACLAALLVSLLETAGEASYLRQIWSRASVLYSSFPEIASRASLWASVSVCLLGWLVAWNAMHWTYAGANWFGADPVGPDQSIGLIIPAIIAAVGGIRLGFAVGMKQDARTPLLDRQGALLAFLGIGIIVAAAAVNHVLKAERILILYPQIVIPLVLVGLAFLWGVTFGSLVPALAAGRPSRFDLWSELAGKLSLGVMAAGLLCPIWQYWGGGNLLAIAFASLLAIAVGGVVIIYGESGQPSKKHKARSATVAHLTRIGVLYLSLIFITVVVPHVKYSWLTPTVANDLIVSESPAGAAFLKTDSPRELAWASRILFPERVDSGLRAEYQSIVRQIVDQAAGKKGSPVQVLTVGAPFLTNDAIKSWPIRQLHQIDIDRTLRRLEFRHLTLDPNAPAPDLLDLPSRRLAYDVVIVMLPDRWPMTQSWPSPVFLLKRLQAMTQHPGGMWTLSLLPEYHREDEDVRLSSLNGILENGDVSSLRSRCLTAKGGRQWRIFSPSPTLEKIDLENRK